MISQSIAAALTAEQARMVAGEFLRAVERNDDLPDIGTLLADLQHATRMAERLAQVTEEWQDMAQRAKCARCGKPRRKRDRRICPDCRAKEPRKVPGQEVAA